MKTGKILGEKYIENGLVEKVSDFTPDMSAAIFYEVVRLIDGKFLFLKDHFERFKQSLSGSGLQYPGPEIIRENLRLLQKNNDFTIGNIRISLQPGAGEHTRLLCYYVPYIYPEICMYKSGVQLVSYSHVRPNPGIKKWDDQFRRSVKEAMRDYGVYEVVLINNENQITEGSRSNIFFLDKSDRLITPPSKDILPGITRKYVLQISSDENIEVLEKPVHRNELGDLTSCFITGTSPKVLPVWQLDGFQYKVDHPLLELLINRFDELMENNLENLVKLGRETQNNNYSAFVILYSNPSKHTIMKRFHIFLISLLIIISLQTSAQKVYHTNGAEIIFSGSDVTLGGSNINTNIRFTAFFHAQQLINLDITNNIGIYTGFAIRNIGLITEDVYQKMGFVADEGHDDWDKNIKMKRRSYSLGFPLALKLGSFSKHFFLYAGGEYEWMFHYKQKFWIDGEKRKLKGWTNDRVTPWIPSFFAGIQFPQGFNLKFKYYLDDFLNHDFDGSDFGRPVDYSQFESSGMWYISLAFFLNKDKVKGLIGADTEESAFRY